MTIKIKTADRLFSKFIRGRAGWICERCGKQYPVSAQGLHCSHYFGRAKWATRFDPNNCIALDYGCHQFWGSTDREQYRRYMIEKLGEDGFKDLELRSNSYIKQDWQSAAVSAKNLLNSLQ